MTDLADLPTGTVTFLFTDLEGSTRLLEAHPDAYRDAVRRHHDLLRGAVEGHGGVVFETVGDAVYAAFAQATDAVAAALAGQLALHREDWGERPLRARMGVHLGEVERQGGHYFGVPLYRCARLMATAHGGQVVLSEAAVVLVRDALPPGVALRELGAHRLKDLQQPERVAQLTHPGLPAEFPTLRTLDAWPHNLPLQVTSFVGREWEVAEVTRLLAAHRLVTLTGPGGTGKTRLALQAAAEVLDRYPDGVWLVELAALANPALVPQAVAQAVGVREEAGRPLVATLTDALRSKRLLLLLDNCEHLLDACARLADALLRAGPHLGLLTTSRETLGMAGEAPYRVPSLALPEPGSRPSVAALAHSEAVRLFVERATVVQPTFALTDHNAPAVAQVCARLDGIPLALELAAARVRVLPVEQLLARLEDRFRLLTGGSRTALERHQTLRAAVDWSYALLPDPERTLFARLAVFAGGWTLEAAEAVCAGEGIAPDEVLDLLTHLVDKSLVGQETLPDGSGRYRLLETLRQYAQQKLAASGDGAAVRGRHATCYLALAEQAEPELTRAGSAAWLDRLMRDLDNVRVALQWAATQRDAELGLRLAAALFWFWIWRYPVEGRAWLTRLLALPGGEARATTRVRALAAAGWLAWRVGDLEAARVTCEAGLALAREVGDRGAAWLLTALGWIASGRGEDAVARSLLDASLALAEAVGDRLSVTYILRALAGIARRAGDSARAGAYLERALALLREAGYTIGIGGVFLELGVLARDQGDATGARRAYEASLAAYRTGGDPLGCASALHGLARVAVRQADYPTARAAFAECLRIAAQAGMQRRVAHTLSGLAVVAGAEGHWEHALRLTGAAEAFVTAISASQLDPVISGLIEADVDHVRAQGRAALSEPALAAACAAGQAMTLEQAVAYALEEDRGDA